MSDIFDLLNDESEDAQSDALPAWVSSKNATLKAYEAINEIKLIKYGYIKENGLKTAYRTSKVFLVGKSEVADKISITRQALFSASAYSKDLSEYLESVNSDLKEKKEARLKRKGMRAKQKSELLDVVKEKSEQVDYYKQREVKEVLQQVLDQMSLATKKTLGLR
jgi:hypothetical protein